MEIGDRAACRWLRTANTARCHAKCFQRTRRACRQIQLGLSVEPANLVLCGQSYGPEAIGRLGPHVLNVYVQNVRLTETGSSSIVTNSGTMYYERLVVGEEGGIDFELFLAGLRSINYDGFVTTHQSAMEGKSTRELAQFMFDRLARFL